MTDHPSTRKGRPLPAAQTALFLAEESGSVPGSYNIPVQVQVQGNISDEQLEDSCRRLYQTTSALRMRIGLAAGSGQLVYWFSPEFPGLARYSVDEPGAGATIADLLGRSFEVDEGPLVRFAVLRTSRRTASVIAVAHHLVLDGWSQAALVDRLASCISGASGADDEAEQIAMMHRTSVEQTVARTRYRDYWRDRLDAPIEPAVPSTWPEHTTTGGLRTFSLQQDELISLREAAQALDVSIFQILLASVHFSLPGARAGAATIVCTAVSQRPRSDPGRQLIGCLVNELPMVARHEPGDCLSELLGRESPHWAKDLRYRAFPFMDSVDLIDRRLGRRIRFNSVMLSYRPCARLLQRRFPGLECTSDLAFTYRASMSELSVRYLEHPDGITCYVQWGPMLTDEVGNAFSAKLMNTVGRASKEIIDSLPRSRAAS
jgi:hypothetical protein